MKNILVVEDSKSVSSALQSLLIKELKCNCVVARSQKEASEALLQYKGKFSVALLDLGLPDAPNGEIVDFVTKFDIPTIILTGSNLEEDEKKYRSKNIVDYVIKDGMYSFNYAVNVVKRIVSNYHQKVLVVDDSKSFLAKAVDLINRYKLTSFTALNGEEALKVLEENPDIKIVLTDYYMPIIDGLELTRKIRKKYSKDELSIIVTSESNNTRMPSKFLKYGANDFLYKGFTEEEFYARLNANLEILELFENVRKQAHTDHLTGLHNRRYLFSQGAELYETVKQKNEDFAVAIIDIDKFKDINDNYGHDIGDIAIKEVSILLESCIKENALITRLGGEEFCILLTKRDKKEVRILLEKVRKTFENNIICSSVGDLSYTVSIGCSFDLKSNLDEMIQCADYGLFDAKNAGRNQVRYRK